MGSILHSNTMLNIAVVFLSILGILVSILNSRINREMKQNDYHKKVKSIVNTIYEDKITKGPQLTGLETDFINQGNTESEKTKLELAVHQSLMSVHQKQALMHSRVQFYIGIFMSVIGFVFFIYVVFMSINSSNNNLGMGIQVTGSLVFEGISLLFLKESHRLRESSKEYHDNLYESNKHQEAIKIVDSIEDLNIQSAVKAQLSLHLVGVNSDNVDITKIIKSQKE
ncbi:hypothetical protein [Heyndrickxia acidicola]|uniref:Uncharacterized protein n=1 Tax=Heyndrickxia acidicola TaxID=209389 RepID=A0ABU6M9X1_9BACI|nr:hypothetical protein [Heyndrickxia acidicola]MED1201491.1 hypothetical protein [Heyndrickxia acidicola]